MVGSGAGCGDVSDCIARTAPGKWLLQHAAEFGFELSFPAGNAQGVTWEPWHWRWVGTSAAVPGAAAARALFTTARTRFPAQPGIRDVALAQGMRTLLDDGVAKALAGLTTLDELKRVVSVEDAATMAT